MFKNKKDDEADFCESYKSQILNDNSTEKVSSFHIILKLLTIVLLLAIIVAVSIYGYNYFLNKHSDSALPPVSVQISDDDLKITEESPENEQEEVSVEVPSVSKIEEADIDQIANDVKIAIANSEKLEENSTEKKSEVKVEKVEEPTEINLSKEEESLEIPTDSPEAQYLEELADLSKEIDKERK